MCAFAVIQLTLRSKLQGLGRGSQGLENLMGNLAWWAPLGAIYTLAPSLGVGYMRY